MLLGNAAKDGGITVLGYEPCYQSVLDEATATRPSYRSLEARWLYSRQLFRSACGNAIRVTRDYDACQFTKRIMNYLYERSPTFHSQRYPFSKEEIPAHSSSRTCRSDAVN